MATGKQLYDESGNSIYPLSYASLITSEISGLAADVKSVLESIISRLTSVEQISSGEKAIEGALSVSATYTRTTTKNKPTEGFTSSFVLPDSSYPYAWKKTIYTWTSNGISTSFDTVEIVATALYPETQIMYTVAGSTDGTISGPSEYVENASDKTTGSTVKWHLNPESISPTKPWAYMATRHRSAQETWDGKSFTVALFGNYAFENTTLIKYYATSGSAPSSSFITDSNASPTGWYDTVQSAISGFASGTTVSIYSTYATKNGSTLVKNGSNYWSLPSLISKFTI